MTLPRLIALTLAASALLSCISAHAASTQSGQVVAVQDGDTLAVMTAQQEYVRIRLAEIDAPETSQPFGPQAKQSLVKLCFGKTARFTRETTDKYLRVVSRVKCNGTDAQTHQVSRGMAWVYERYATDQSLYRVQKQAQRQKRGLWADPEPVPPWDYRRQKRSAK